MKTLLITYDLNKLGQKYDELYEVIKNIGVWWHYLDSTWLVRTNLNVNQVSDKMLGVLDDNDHFLVIDITGDSMQGWLPQKAWDWIHGRAA